MAERLTEIELQLHNVHELQDIVGAMRAVAAIRLQEAQAALTGTRAYAELIGAAIADALPLLPFPPPTVATPTGAASGTVLFMAEHGFTGAFNDQLADALRDRAEALFVIGSRGLALIEERGLSPTFATGMATHVGAVTETARKIAGALSEHYARRRLAFVEILFFRHLGGGRRALERQSLLPVAVEAFGPARAAAPPLANLTPGVLIEGLIEEYLFALLAHAAMESFASENGARLATMQSARDRLEQRLLHLRALEGRLRQEQITAELLELITGTAAVS
jgi:F-type H+-transporting ATPase subunit gamma